MSPRLLDLLRLADFEPPQALLHWLLVGPWDGRRKLVARLGREANDPIDELLNAALAYSAAHTASLQGSSSGSTRARANEARGGRRRQPRAGDDRARLEGAAGADRDPRRRHGQSRQLADARADA
jgi:ATP-dependent helicase/nuclease subunit A